jgi:DNA-binding MarR family transcriptional regulator
LQRSWRGGAERHALRQAGRSLSLAWPLVIISQRQGAARQSAVAARLGIEEASLARLVDQLCATGLVVRQPDPSDGRAKLLQRTAAAEPTIAAQSGWSEILRASLRIRLREMLNTVESSLSLRRHLVATEGARSPGPAAAGGAACRS